MVAWNYTYIFNTICKNLPLDIFVNRIHNQNPLTKENLLNTLKSKTKLKKELESILDKKL